MAVNVWGSRHNYFEQKDNPVSARPSSDLVATDVFDVIALLDAKGLSPLRRMAVTRPNEVIDAYLANVEKCVVTIQNAMRPSPAVTPTFLASQQVAEERSVEVAKETVAPSF